MVLLAGGGRWSGQQELSKWHLAESFRPQEGRDGSQMAGGARFCGERTPYYVTELYVALESLCRMLTGI